MKCLIYVLAALFLLMETVVGTANAQESGDVTLQICNRTPYDAFVATADGFYGNRGWHRVRAGSCSNMSFQYQPELTMFGMYAYAISAHQDDTEPRGVKEWHPSPGAPTSEYCADFAKDFEYLSERDCWTTALGHETRQMVNYGLINWNGSNRFDWELNY